MAKVIPPHQKFLTTREWNLDVGSCSQAQADPGGNILTTPQMSVGVFAAGEVRNKWYR